MIKQSPFKGKLLVCDMDGTLLNSRNMVSDENRAALLRFVEGGGLFTVATGRTAKVLSQYLKQLPVNVPVIVMNGAQIYDFKKKEILYRWCLERDIENTLYGLLDKFPEMGMEIFSDEGVFAVSENYITTEHRNRECIMPGIYDIRDVPKPWYKIVLTWENDKLKMVEAMTEGKMGTAVSLFSELKLLDLIHRNASKGIALKQLCDIIKHPLSEVIAVGDNLNDLDMIKAAGTGVAVENAHEDLKKYARFCACHHDDHAIAQVVRWMEENFQEV